jgi:N-acylglucosamine 2-epimerase
MLSQPASPLSLEDHYRHHLHDVLLPFWLRAVDVEHGGVFTCFDNTGRQLVSTDKYTWSQGRFAWLMGRLARLARQGLIQGDAVHYLEIALHTTRFLKAHAFLPDGSCAYLLTASGKPKESIPGEGHDISIFADCFVILGLAETGRAAQDPELLDIALRTYHQVTRRFEAGGYRSEPYPIPVGFHAHAFPMIFLNVSQELASVLQEAGHGQAEEVTRKSEYYLQQIMQNFFQDDHTVAELVSDYGHDTLLARHYNPGHTLEDMWFILTEALRLKDERLIRQANEAIKRAFELGWDAEHGGLFRFVDREGGFPRGRRIGGKLETLILETWDTKLWWPHSEALYATLFAYTLTKDPATLELYARAHRYAFMTFPNPDREVGEWIQIRDRSGEPLQKVVALPVKDPFHIVRNVLLVLSLLTACRESLQQDKIFLRTIGQIEA